MNRDSNGSREKPVLLEVYIKFRQFTQKGIGQVRDELLPLLYYFYIHLYLTCLTEEYPREYISPIMVFRSDFAHVNSYQKEIQSIDAVNVQPLQGNIKEEKAVQQILNTNKTITVSQYTFEVLQMFMQKQPRANDTFQTLVSAMKIDLRIAKDPETEANKMSNGIASSLNFDEIKKINDAKIKLTPLKDDVYFLYKLDMLYDAKKKNELTLNSKKTRDKLLSDPDVYESSYLEKSEMPLPEVKFRHKVDIAKAFLDKPGLDENEANILNISVKDPWEKITCVEISKKGNILLLGMDDFKIIMIILNPGFSDANMLEKHKKKHLEHLSKELSVPLDERLQPEQGKKGDKSFAVPSSKEDDKHQTSEFIGHEDAITCISLNYDDLYFVSASVDTTLRLWDIRQRTCLGVFKGHINTIWCVKFSPKGYYFASGSSDTSVRLWTTDRPFTVRVLTGHTSDVHLVDFVENCNYVITASYDKTVRIWELYSARCCKVLFHNNEVVSAFNMNYTGSHLVTGSEDGLAILWDMEQDVKVNAFYLEQGKRINSISFSFDGNYLIVSSKHRINTYEIERLKNEQGDMYESVLKGEERLEVLKKKNKNLVANSYFIDTIPDFDFLTTKFSYGNFVLLVSRSFED